ncbi:excalibur calcium-binding domain-containing protein [Blastococcus sp. SYSU D00922]
MVDDVEYEFTSVQAIRGTEDKTIAKWGKNGWEVDRRDQGLLRTELTFRRVKPTTLGSRIGAAFGRLEPTRRRTLLAASAVVVPLFAFLIGVAVGGSGGESDVEASPAYLTLQSELTEKQQEADDLTDQVAEAEAKIRQATDEGEARLAQRMAELEGQKALLDQREAELAAREAAAAQPSQAVTRPAPAASAPAAPAPAAAEPQAPASTYYKNCDAARAAGAAPVRVGDPGYGRHLDREGDGIGCE